jgi:hypothetical protein
MHVTDWFTTIVQTAGAEKPADRVIDGIDQTDWLTGRQPHSNRNSFPYWMGVTLYGAKWRNFKLSLVAHAHVRPADAAGDAAADQSADRSARA